MSVCRNITLQYELKRLMYNQNGLKFDISVISEAYGLHRPRKTLTSKGNNFKRQLGYLEHVVQAYQMRQGGSLARRRLLRGQPRNVPDIGC
jgi:hypothetical protein